MALSKEDLVAIAQVVREQIQDTVPEIVDDRIQAVVPGIVDDRIQAIVPGIVDDRIQAIVPGIVDDRIQAIVPGIVDDRIQAIVPGIVDDRIDNRVPDMIAEKLRHSENLILKEVDRVWDVAQENRKEIKALREDVRALKARTDIRDLYGLVGQLAVRMDHLEEKLTEHLESQGA
ncbi:hypothetical protein [Hominifimenecus sp. rT4P-3]|uniref:hypothetical protein n=1 Tax=Hominifimenecus sp. rT4P-3 TaxID=3242979 RepID=UPI003DA6C707